MMTGRQISKLWRLVFGAAVALGCNGEDPEPAGLLRPELEEVVVDAARHQEPVTVKARLRNPGGANLHVHDVLLSYRTQRIEESPYEDAGEMTLSGTWYEGSLPPLNYGPYEAHVKAVLRPLVIEGGEPPAPDTILEKTQTFFVAGSPACFEFSEGPQGWTFDGIYDSQSGDQLREPGCPDFGTWIATDGGSLTAIISPTACFPEEDPPGGLWRFDYLSPDLADNGDWAGLQEVAIRIRSNVPLQMQPITTYLEEGATEETTIAPVDTAGERIFYQLSSATQTFYTPAPVPEGATVTRFRVRIFGQPSQMVITPESLCQLYLVCPLQ